MDRLLFIIIISFGSLLLGYLFQRFLGGLGIVSYRKIDKFSSFLKLFAIAGLQPLAIIHSFWNLSLDNSELFILPFFGVLAILTGGVSSLVQTHLFKIPPKKAASIFVSGMFSNFGIFGGLIAFVLYGSLGFSIVQLFRVFEEIIYYAIGFPISNLISKGKIKAFRIKMSLLSDRPIIFIPISAIIIGFLLNFLPINSPPVFELITNYIVPLITALIGIGIGLSLKLTKTKDYYKEIILVLVTKYVIIPAIVIPTAYIFGLGNILNGIPLKVVIIVSFMPTAFMALIPPTLYGFDLDLANSAWLITTLFLLIIFPCIYFIISL